MQAQADRPARPDYARVVPARRQCLLSVWETIPGTLVRLNIDSNLPQTCKAEVYNGPFRGQQLPRALRPKQVQGLERADCDGDHCPEGWTLEGGKGTKGKSVKKQLRPNPLAK